MKNPSLSDLLTEELASLLNAESQLADALPGFMEASHSPALKRTLESHLKMTQEQIGRLEDIFSRIGQNPRRRDNRSVQTLMQEGRGVIRQDDGMTRDTAIIGVGQRFKRCELEGYAIACQHATHLGHARMV
jgi:ferritin-like metal-binding protein YciE